MWWMLAALVAITIFSKLEDLIDLFKMKHPHYQQEKEKERLARDQERLEMVRQLREAINSECQIESTQFIYMSRSNTITGKIVNLDDEWLELITKNKKANLFIKIADIASVSKIL